MSKTVNMIVLARGDNVGIAARDIASGDLACDIRGIEVPAQDAITQGHKIALENIAKGQSIIRYGMPVGVSTAAIAMGHLVHVHNVASRYLNNDQDHFE